MQNKPSLPSPWATTLGSVYSGRRPISQLNKREKEYPVIEMIQYSRHTGVNTGYCFWSYCLTSIIGLNQS